MALRSYVGDSVAADLSGTTLRRRCPSSMVPASAGSRAFRQVWVCTWLLASHYCSPRRASRVRDVLLLRAFSSESFNTTIHGCWTADARRLQSRMIRFRKEEMLLNFLVRFSLLVIAPLKEFAEVPSVFTVTFSVFFYHFLSCLVVSLRWQALPQQFAEDSVYCSGAKAVVGRGVRLLLSSLNDEITHATVVMIVGKHVSLCGYGEVCAFAFRVSRVSPERVDSAEFPYSVCLARHRIQYRRTTFLAVFGMSFSCSLFVVLSAARPLQSSCTS